MVFCTQKRHHIHPQTAPSSDDLEASTKAHPHPDAERLVDVAAACPKSFLGASVFRFSPKQKNKNQGVPKTKHVACMHAYAYYIYIICMYVYNYIYIYANIHTHTHMRLVYTRYVITS